MSMLVHLGVWVLVYRWHATVCSYLYFCFRVFLPLIYTGGRRRRFSSLRPGGGRALYPGGRLSSGVNKVNQHVLLVCERGDFIRQGRACLTCPGKCRVLQVYDTRCHPVHCHSCRALGALELTILSDGIVEGCWCRFHWLVEKPMQSFLSPLVTPLSRIEASDSEHASL